jgi:hypothetical protein
VKIPGGDSFAVRALSFSELSFIIEKFGDALEGLFQDMLSNGGDIQAASVTTLVVDIIRRSPEAIDNAIALAGDYAGLDNTVELLLASQHMSKLPFSVQVDAVQKICELTFASEAALKKAMETAGKLLGRFSKLAEAQAA